MKCQIHPEIELEEVWEELHRPDYICSRCLEIQAELENNEVLKDEL